MSKLTIAPIQAGYRSAESLTENFEAIAEALENTLSRDGTSPNQMEADLDMNSNRIINLPEPTLDSEAVRLQDLTAQTPIFEALLEETQAARDAAIEANESAEEAQGLAESARSGAEAAQAAAEEARDEVVGVASSKANLDLANVSAETFGNKLSPGGWGTALRSISLRAGDQLNIKDALEGVQTGVEENDTDALNLLIAHAQTLGTSRKLLYLPGGAEYLIGETPSAITGDDWHLRGDGRGVTVLRTSYDGDILQIDTSSQSSQSGSITDLSLRARTSGAYTNTVGLKVLGDTGSNTGLRYWRFDFDVQNVYRGIDIEEGGRSAWEGIDQISPHGYNEFLNFEVLPAATNLCFDAVRFQGSLNLHNLFLGGRYRGTNRAFVAGDGSAFSSVGDSIFMGVHFLAASGSGDRIAVELIGGTDSQSYNENVQFIGCQFENVGGPYKFHRMRQTQIIGANTNTVAGQLIDCDDASISFTRRGYSVMPGLRPSPNLLINGDFQIWQRGTSFTPTTVAFMADRWQGRRAANASGATYSRQTGFSGSRYCMRMARNAANTDVNPLLIGEQIDFPEVVKLQGRHVTFSLDARKGADYSGGDLTLRIATGTAEEVVSVATGFATGNALSETYLPLSLAAGRLVSSTYLVPANAAALAVILQWTPTGTAGAADYVEITNIKLEAGEIGTPHEARPEAEELALCQRFYEKSFALATTPVNNLGEDTGETIFPATAAAAATNRSPTIPFRRPKRSATGMTVTLYSPRVAGSGQVSNETNAGTCSASTVVRAGQHGFGVECTGTAFTAIGDRLAFHWSADAEIK